MYINIARTEFKVYPIVQRELSIDYTSILYGDRIKDVTDNFDDLLDLVTKSTQFEITVSKTNRESGLNSGDEYVFFKEDNVLRVTKSKDKTSQVESPLLPILISKILSSEEDIKQDYLDRVKSNSIDFINNVMGNCETMLDYINNVK